jgi:Fic family protein
MKVVAPPPYNDLFMKYVTDIPKMMDYGIGPEVRGTYEHWDHLRYLAPPNGIDVEAWWLMIKWARNPILRNLPLKDKSGAPIRVAVTDSMLRVLHFLDREAAGSIQGLDTIEHKDVRNRYLIRSLIEEAMTSSQLEGASTTRQVAKEMLATGRQPRDRSERMIWNNYHAMRLLARLRTEPLTPNAIFDMHRILTLDAIDDPTAAGRLRRKDELIEVVDRDGGRVLHVPPLADELPDRIQLLCDFANKEDDVGFLHPIVRAIAIHFQIGYDHPFVDGNGRTARALFYWSMLRSGYWLTEYLSISSALKKAPAQYNRAYLYTETDESDLSYFVAHQLKTLEEAVEGLRDYVARKSRDQRAAEALLKPGSKLGARLNHRQREILLEALRNQNFAIKISEHQSSQGISYQTARSDLLGLVEEGLMQQIKHSRAFAFAPVPDLEDRLKKERGAITDGLDTMQTLAR